jgi:hypothetical protein
MVETSAKVSEGRWVRQIIARLTTAFSVDVGKEDTNCGQKLPDQLIFDLLSS